ncbi:hypothetical protein GQR58_010526 [Nymphon striatum]|nr:hypothetical protein GQR58_010526 [Nymphon striatum]
MKRKIRRIAFMVVAATIAGGVNYYNTHYKNQSSSNTNTSSTTAKNQSGKNEASKSQQQAVDRIRKAAGNTQSQFWVTVQGRVFKLLKDDLKGSRHQKFLIKIAPDISLLISHNIDLAKHVPVKQGDQINVRGRYEWNNRGGLIHWTHHDPKDISNTIATTMPELKQHVSNMSQNVTSLSNSADSMATSTQHMGQSTWEINRSISKPMRAMNKMIPWNVDTPPPMMYRPY